MTVFTLKTPFAGKSCPRCHRAPSPGQEVQFRDAFWPSSDSIGCPPWRLRLWHADCAERAITEELERII